MPLDIVIEPPSPPHFSTTVTAAPACSAAIAAAVHRRLGRANAVRLLGLDRKLALTP